VWQNVHVKKSREENILSKKSLGSNKERIRRGGQARRCEKTKNENNTINKLGGSERSTRKTDESREYTVNGGENKR